VPRSQNLSRAFNVQQGKDEGPTEFMSCLKHQMRKYAGLDLEDPLGQGPLNRNVKISLCYKQLARYSKKITKTGKIDP
jgi:hypothetical protein